MTSNYVLLQYGQEPWPARFEDLEGRLAFTVYVYAHYCASFYDLELSFPVFSNTVCGIS